jgi:hemoglobin
LVAVVDDFFGRAAADARVNRKFAKTDVTRYKFRLVQQLCHVTGGPCPDVPRDMAAVHGNLGITDGEFDAVVEILVTTLSAFKVPKAEQTELLGILGPLRGQIVEVQSKATGTPLSAAFHPAGPLTASERKKVEEYERRHSTPAKGKGKGKGK